MKNFLLNFYILAVNPDLIFFKPYSHCFNLSSQKQGALYKSQEYFIKQLRTFINDLGNFINNPRRYRKEKNSFSYWNYGFWKNINDNTLFTRDCKIL